MSITAVQKKRLRTLGHGLNPVVTVATKGLTESVIAEIDRALNDHELIKVRLTVGDRELKKSIIEDICGRLGAEAVQVIGHVLLLFRKAEKPNPRLSNLLR
ncbi:MAG: ribosome assembly RNA-binding protein YhbY [Porticoccaceae bacterium]|nr:ribosome assembly RNA-binding protein YhbY [Porticoccaceae bacterium]